MQGEEAVLYTHAHIHTHTHTHKHTPTQTLLSCCHTGRQCLPSRHDEMVVNSIVCVREGGEDKRDREREREREREKERERERASERT